MHTILALALLTNTYDMIGDPIPAQSLVMIGCAPVVKPLVKEEETDEDSYVAENTLVVVYVDLDDHKTLRRITEDCDSIEGLQFTFRDSSRIPAEGRGKKLPLLHYHTDSGWKFYSGWPGAFEFSQRWVAGNSGKELQTHNQDVQVRSSQRGNQNSSVANYPIRGSWWTGCSDWRHLTQGQHAGKFDAKWLRGLSNAEVQSLHSDDHEGRVKWSYINRFVPSQPSPAKSQQRTWRAFAPRGVYCPSGNCPWAKS